MCLSCTHSTRITSVIPHTLSTVIGSIYGRINNTHQSTIGLQITSIHPGKSSSGNLTQTIIAKDFTTPTRQKNLHAHAPGFHYQVFRNFVITPPKKIQEISIPFPHFPPLKFLALFYISPLP